MYLDLVLWLICFFINIALLALNFYQILNLSDLEDDYINPYDSSSHINAVVVPEFVVHGVLCAIFLLTWHWLMFLMTLPITYYNIMLFMKRQHLIDVTEIFRFLKEEKKKRIVKLVFYIFLFIIVIIRLVLSVFNSLVFEDEALHDFGITV
ncbi:protein cornichon homolog 1 isoform X2 [Malania oleifera]|uniref:protein cornichon homolog 1 isoform X2 n=1 Tax=Malania oleifera TaxID=397392 RepID=UPI0025AE9F2B|nr:protein cornichon homolog 1 isoform X2 [Malania oleifera]